MAQEDLETLFNRLNKKIESEVLQPGWPDVTQFDAYLKWMQIKAADRDRAKEYAMLAEKEGNPYWRNKFIWLSEQAQWSGEATIRHAIDKFMDPEDHRTNRPVGWGQACDRAGPHLGERLYMHAIEYGFRTDDVLDAVKCLLRYATNDLEASYLYVDQESFLGSYDAQGLQVMPKGDWNAYCMRRGEFTTTYQGEPVAPADKAMADALKEEQGKQQRQVAGHFQPQSATSG